jgi:hypothetical protein
MSRVVNIPLPGIGHDTFQIYPDMFLVDGVNPTGVRVYAAGVFFNCSRVSDTILHIDNPATEPATFTFEIEYRLGEEPSWTYAPNWYQVGTRYKSLGHTYTDCDLRTTLGDESLLASEIWVSPKINPYSKYKSDKLDPHLSSEFLLYTHTMPGGCRFDYELWVKAPNASAYSYAMKTTGVPYRYNYKLLGWLASIWVALEGKPYTYTKLIVADQTGEPVALASGGRGTFLWSGLLTNNSSSGGTETYYIKSYHCATLNGTYVEGSSITVNVNLDGKPYSVSVDAGYPTKDLDTASIQIDYYGTGHLIRFSIKPHSTWEYVDHQTYGNEANIVMDVIHQDNIGRGIAWKLEVEYPAGSGVWEKEFEGTL